MLRLIRCSILRSQGRTRPGLWLEQLETRTVPTVFKWTGGGITDNITPDTPDPGTMDWSVEDNWIREFPTGNHMIPGATDVVKFNGALAGIGKMTPRMEAAYTVARLELVGNYHLTLDGKLTITGDTVSQMKGGKISGNEIVFDPPENALGSTFIWEGGTLATVVTLPAKTTLQIMSDNSKTLSQKMQVNSLNATWDGKNTTDANKEFWIDGNNGELVIGSGATFVINSAPDDTTQPFLGVSAGSKFTNYGTVTVSRHTLLMNGPGWVANRGQWNVTYGTLYARNMVNAGTMNLSANTSLQVGTWENQPVASTLVLDSRAAASPTHTSLIEGDGKVYLARLTTVSIPETKATVTNVEDYGLSVEGAGSLVIAGTYNWNISQPNLASSTWSGTGKVYVGTDDNRSATLNLKAVHHTSSRQFVIYGTTTWYSSALAPAPPDPLPAAWKSLTYESAGIDIKGPHNPTDEKPSFLVVSSDPFTQALTGDITSAGYLYLSSGKMIDITGKYTETGKALYKTDRTRREAKINLADKVVMHTGTIDNGAGVDLTFAGGFEQTGGDVISAGMLTIIGGYNMSGGTFTATGNFDEEEVEAFIVDDLEQTGGILTAVVGNLKFDVTGTYDFIDGEAWIHILPPLESGIPMPHIGTLTVSNDDFKLGGALVVDDPLEVTEDGIIEMVNGTAVYGDVQIDGQADMDGGTHITGNVVNNGIIHAGMPDLYGIQILEIIGNYTQTAYGTLILDLAEMNADLLVVSGTATLDGTLSLVQPAWGLNYLSSPTMLIQAGGVSGYFTGMMEGQTVLTLNNVDYDISYLGGDGNDVILAGF